MKTTTHPTTSHPRPQGLLNRIFSEGGIVDRVFGVDEETKETRRLEAKIDLYLSRVAHESNSLKALALRPKTALQSSTTPPPFPRAARPTCTFCDLTAEQLQPGNKMLGSDKIGVCDYCLERNR